MQTCAWELLYDCNYRCPYCFFHASRGAETVRPSCSAPEWLAFGERLFQRHGAFLIDLAGGEPFLYPGFAALVSGLGRRHTARVITNLSWDPERVLGSWDPERVQLVASFHPSQAGRDAFLAKARRLRAAGFPVCAVVVGHPSLWPQLPGLRRDFLDAGLRCLILPFLGEADGRIYPTAYSPEQTAWLREADRELDPALDFVLGGRSPKGLPCVSGHRYFRAYPDGSIFRCVHDRAQAPDQPLGSIRDPDFRLEPAPRPCPADRCVCHVEAGLLGLACR